MGTITTISIIKLTVKIAIFIGCVVGINYIENLINKKPTLKRGGRNESDNISEAIHR